MYSEHNLFKRAGYEYIDEISNPKIAHKKTQLSLG